MKNLLLLITALFLSFTSFSQVEFILYRIDYNSNSGHFDCKIKLEGGTATTVQERTLLDAKLSFVVETGITVAIEERFFPIYDNEDYMGTLSIEWLPDEMVTNPPEFPGYDIISFVPDLTSASQFNDLYSGNEITLFSLSATGINACETSIRLYNNSSDPSGFSGGEDFTQSIMIGSNFESYIGNHLQENINQFIDVTLTEGNICFGDCYTIDASFDCVIPGTTFHWSTGETTESITVCPEVSEEFILFLDAPNGYSGERTTYITVNPGIAPLGGTELCVGIEKEYWPGFGLWSSSDESIVTVTNEGLVTPLAPGTATISKTSTLGECYDEVVVTVTQPELPFLDGESEICTGETTQFLPSSEVNWFSADPSIATIDDSGLVTGTGAGSTYFSFNTVQGQCPSIQSEFVTVILTPDPKITGEDTICQGTMTSLSPTAGVLWESSDPSVATIDNEGNVTGIAPGDVTFFFTDLASNCVSILSDPITVLPIPTVDLESDTVCQGSVIVASADEEGGTWSTVVVSGSTDAVSMDVVTGIITTNAPGQVIIKYLGTNGCYSDDAAVLTILPKPEVTIKSEGPVCMGGTMILESEETYSDSATYQWTGPNAFTSNEKSVIVPNVDVSWAGTYTLVVTEQACPSDPALILIEVEDCDPCDDSSSEVQWEQKLVNDKSFEFISDYEIGSNLVSGRDLEDFVYYDTEEQAIKLIMNNSNEFFDEEVELFDLEYLGIFVAFDIVDIDMDGLNDVVVYQLNNTSETGLENILEISIFRNLDNFSFEPMMNFEEESGEDYLTGPMRYEDLNHHGYMDIIPLNGPIYFLNEFGEDAWQGPPHIQYILVKDVNNDGLLDIFCTHAVFLLNNGSSSFDSKFLLNAELTGLGLFDSSTGVLVNGTNSYEILSENMYVTEFCNGPTIADPVSFFTAHISSDDVENGIIGVADGFHVFESPMTCENSLNNVKIDDFVPEERGKIDLDGNGFSDFITVQDNQIYVWINPNDQPKVQGLAFVDYNGDGIFNENDSPLRNVMVSIEPEDLTVLTDDDGRYQFAVPEGTYTLTAKVNQGSWVDDELQIIDFEVSEPCNTGFDFGFVPDSIALPMVELSMVNSIARCDFETRFTITVENTSADVIEAQLQFEYDDKTTLFDVDIAGYTTAGNVVLADLGQLDPFKPQTYVITLKMPGGSALLPILDFEARLVNQDGALLKAYGYSEQLRCSYDPNDKRVFPDRQGDQNLTLMDEFLEYTIRFQNNGNDTAYNVKIIDPLDPGIDPTSIYVVSSSHEVETCIEGSNLIFLFEDIYLVDSMTNYDASQGFVTFKCRVFEGIDELTLVENRADIIFDTNDAIVTNTTVNTMVTTLCTDKTTVINEYICEGEDYLGYTETGVYTNSYVLDYGCDSTVTINLTVQGITYAQQSFFMCEAGSIVIGSNDYYIENSTTIVDTVINDQGCISHILKYEVTITDDPIEVEMFEMCVNEIVNITNAPAGFWTSDDESIVEVTQTGSVISVAPGSVKVLFEDVQGCIDEIQVNVHALPEIFTDDVEEICIGEIALWTSDTDGQWTSSDPSIATISSSGSIEGVSEGIVEISLTNEMSGCTTSEVINVLSAGHVDCLVNTQDDEVQDILLYPNPASSDLIVESKEEWQSLRIYSVQGQAVSPSITSFEKRKRIDVKDFVNGLYFVKIEMEEKRLMKKLVID